MAFPLKSGADLYNQQLIRAAIWNHGADPSETVTGLFYFNTSNSSAGKKLRLYTGSAWKTLAFEEDLDVANNAEFKALEDKVKLLAGEVDTDAIISNMKEVSNFLAGFAEDANLMSVLDGKLDKSGGTISGAGTIDIRRSEGPYSSIIKFSNKSSVLGYIGFNSEKSFSVWPDLDSSPYTLLHSGNYSLYALPVIGGAIGKGNSNNFPLTISSTSSYTGFTIETSEGMAYFRYQGGSKWGVTDVGWKNSYTLLHSGNVGEYNAGSANMLKYIGKIGSSGFNANTDLAGGGFVSNFGNVSWWGSYVPSTLSYGVVCQLQGSQSNADLSGQLAWDVNYYGADSTRTLWWRANNDTNFANAKWHQIAFTDSTVEAARKLVNSNGNVLLYTANSNILYDGKGRVLMDYADDWQVFGDWTGYKTGIRGSSIEMAIDGKIAAFINSSGNVTIGSSDLAGTSAKLWVQGDSALMGNVGIGLTNPSAKLHVAQDIVANGTIACKGIAAEGDAMDMVDKVVLHIVPNGNQQTFTLNHGLGTREITISIYEITSMGTNMILTDVEIVNDNSISVSFGNPPTENHMVVVMG